MDELISHLKSLVSVKSNKYKCQHTLAFLSGYAVANEMIKYNNRTIYMNFELITLLVEPALNNPDIMILLEKLSIAHIEDCNLLDILSGYYPGYYIGEDFYKQKHNLLDHYIDFKTKQGE